MKYLCLIYDDEKKAGAMSKSEQDALMQDYYAFTEDIKKSGHYQSGEALKPVQTATSVRMRNGKLSTTDGPLWRSCSATSTIRIAFFAARPISINNPIWK